MMNLEGRRMKHKRFSAERFIVHHSTFLVSIWSDYANALARPGLPRANAREETRLHADCYRHAGVGHRSEHRDFQRRQRRVVTDDALSGFRPPGNAVGR